MKRLLFVFFLIITIGFTQTIQAQFFDKLKKKTEQKIKKEGEKRVEDKVNKGVDKAYDEAEKQLEGNNDSKEGQQDSTKVVNKSKNVKDNKVNESVTKETENNPQVVINSKYDFVPGEKIIFFDDFTTENIDDFPVQWNTTGSGEVVTTNIADGR